MAKALQTRHGDLGTFVIQVKQTQNGTWQGDLSWVDQNQKQCFRSALELLKLIDGALEQTTEEADEDEKAQ